MSQSDAPSIAASKHHAGCARWRNSPRFGAISKTLRGCMSSSCLTGSYEVAALPCSSSVLRGSRQRRHRVVIPKLTKKFRCTACGKTRSKLQMTVMSVRDVWCQHCHYLYGEWCATTRPRTRGLDSLAAEREFVMLVKRGGDLNNESAIEHREAPDQDREVDRADEPRPERGTVASPSQGDSA